MTTEIQMVERIGKQEWHIQVERSLGDLSATGEVVVRQESAPEEHSSHAILAGSRAWLVLGEKALEEGDVAAAISAARAGLAELGRDYASPIVKDDTGLNIAVAEELISDGRASDGADLMLRMLRTRCSLYVRLHSDEVVR